MEIFAKDSNDWIKKEIYLHGVEQDIELHHLYRSLDFLERKAKKIEDTLYYQDLNLFNAHVDLVFFDTTSIKFYGEENELMQRGLSKDKRGDLAVPPRVLEIEKNVVGTPEITGEKCPNIGKF